MNLTATSSTALLAAVIMAASGCGSNSTAASSVNGASGAPSTQPASTSPTTAPPSSGPGALLAESQQAAAGDIPDNQVFLRYHDGAAGYTMKYPEGWSVRGSGSDVTILDKNNVIHVVADHGQATPTQAGADMQQLAKATPRFSSKPPVAHPSCTNMGVRTPLPQVAVHVVYTTQSARNPVTGKRSLLSVDRYYLSHGGKRVVVDLGTPQGVDNVDAYCLMISSFRWS